MYNLLHNLCKSDIPLTCGYDINTVNKPYNKLSESDMSELLTHQPTMLDIQTDWKIKFARVQHT